MEIIGILLVSKKNNQTTKKKTPTPHILKIGQYIVLYSIRHPLFYKLRWQLVHYLIIPAWMKKQMRMVFGRDAELTVYFCITPCAKLFILSISFSLSPCICVFLGGCLWKPWSLGVCFIFDESYFHFILPDELTLSTAHHTKRALSFIFHVLMEQKTS